MLVSTAREQSVEVAHVPAWPDGVEERREEHHAKDHGAADHEEDDDPEFEEELVKGEEEERRGAESRDGSTQNAFTQVRQHRLRTTVPIPSVALEVGVAQMDGVVDTQANDHDENDSLQHTKLPSHPEDERLGPEDDDGNDRNGVERHDSIARDDEQDAKADYKRNDDVGAALPLDYILKFVIVEPVEMKIRPGDSKKREKQRA